MSEIAINPPATPDDIAIVGALTARDPDLDATARRLTGRTLLGMVIDEGGIPTYRFSLDICSRPASVVLADAYDAAQASRGDPRRIYRMGCWRYGCDRCYPPLTPTRRPARTSKRAPRQVVLIEVAGG